MRLWRGKPYHSLNSWFRERYGEKVYRVSLDGGFTCPNRDGTLARGGCIYCNEAGARAGHVDPYLSIPEQIIEGKAMIRARYQAQKFLAYFQAYSGTYAAPEHLMQLYQAALSQEDIIGISIGTRPDCVNPAVLDLLEELARDHLVILEYGVQTVHPHSLELINRHHSVEDSRNAIQLSKKRKNIHVLAHLIMGLPGESYSDMAASVNTCLDWGIDAFKIHHLYVEKGTALSHYRTEHPFDYLDREEYIRFLGDILQSIPPEIVIHRLFGQCTPKDLEGPLWTKDKNENLRILDQYLIKNGIFQGSAL